VIKRTVDPKIAKIGKSAKSGKLYPDRFKLQTHGLNSRDVATAQEQNLDDVGGTESDPAEVSPDQVLGWVGQGFSIFSDVIGPIIGAEGGQLVGSEGTAPPSQAGVLVVSDPSTGASAVVEARKLILPITLGAVALLGLVLLVALRR